jgi:CubicO group peptidase (beta-lactamase class C family)
MADTGFWVPSEKKTRLARVYQGRTGNLKPYTDSYLGIRNDMAGAPAFESGGAGLVSTVDDYMKFCLMLLQEGRFCGKQILNRETVRFMRSAHIDGPVQNRFLMRLGHLSGYTYGNLMRIMVNPEDAVSFGSRGEYGWDGWLGTYMMIDPANKLAFVYMQQRTDCGTTCYTRRLRNALYAAL